MSNILVSKRRLKVSKTKPQLKYGIYLPKLTLTRKLYKKM